MHQVEREEDQEEGQSVLSGFVCSDTVRSIRLTQDEGLMGIRYTGEGGHSHTVAGRKSR
jgi:hypothetical protein